jgi:hypothetical protein
MLCHGERDPLNMDENPTSELILHGPQSWPNMKDKFRCKKLRRYCHEGKGQDLDANQENERCFLQPFWIPQTGTGWFIVKHEYLFCSPCILVGKLWNKWRTTPHPKVILRLENSTSTYNTTLEFSKSPHTYLPSPYGISNYNMALKEMILKHNSCYVNYFSNKIEPMNDGESFDIMEVIS